MDFHSVDEEFLLCCLVHSGALSQSVMGTTLHPIFVVMGMIATQFLWIFSYGCFTPMVDKEQYSQIKVAGREFFLPFKRPLLSSFLLLSDDETARAKG